ncbi:MAG: hypothetical protein MUF67_14435, partial [Desulfobacterales bacterium]|nr:hypothetical protein [Desulfobacterales bacterium]
MVGKQGPGVTLRFALGDDLPQAPQEIVTVLVVAKDLAALDSPRDDMVQRPGRIYPGFPWHVVLITKTPAICKSENAKGVPQ